MSVEEQVPLPEHADELISYQRLLLFEKRGLAIDHVEVGADLIEIKVAELLEGIRHPAGLDVFISYAHENTKRMEEFSKI